MDDDAMMDMEKEKETEIVGSDDDAAHSSSSLPSACRLALHCLEDYVDAVERRLQVKAFAETTGDEDTATMEHNLLAFELQKALEEVKAAEMKEEITQTEDPEVAEEKRKVLDEIDVIDGRIAGEREKMHGLITVYRDILMEIPDMKE
eukprot:TRINITY_DN2197_c0_g1_i1.p1 TRINITY_DN2197_c0_g1~~TRINITY_DN2197_c0_g1_i1.p1  ORF type:complete len:148 (+),score=72.76 TRINITY_DN2197_c0_g1_i1:99-542(+)